MRTKYHSISQFDPKPPRTVTEFLAVKRKKRDCWEWPRFVNKQGYGVVYPRLSNRTEYVYVNVHRYLYLMLVGDVPEGWDVDHLCRNRRCANPSHLEAVPVGVNIRRGTNPAAQNARRSECRSGHPLDGPDADLSVYWVEHGRRVCRICLNETARKNHHRRTARRSPATKR